MGTLLEGLFFSPTEWLLIFCVVLLLFGGKKIPEVMKGLGSGIKNFKQAMKDDEEESKPAGSSGTLLPGKTEENSEQGTASKSSESKNNVGN